MKKVRFEILYAHEKRVRNEERSYEKGFMHTCIICGKGIKDVTKAPSLRLIEGGSFITESEEAAENDMGWYPVGNDCYHKYKQAEFEEV